MAFSYLKGKNLTLGEEHCTTRRMPCPSIYDEHTKFRIRKIYPIFNRLCISAQFEFKF